MKKLYLSLLTLASSSALVGMEGNRTLNELIAGGLKLADCVKLVERSGKTYRTLDLHGLGLTSIEGLEKVEGIDRIDLSRNNLTEIPADFVGKYPHLVHLNVSRNKLTSLPTEIGLLKGLRFLSLSYNSLTGLPESFANLTVLRNLNVSHNCLAGFQENIFKHLSALRQLKINSKPNNPKRSAALAPEAELSTADKAQAKALFAATTDILLKT